ncbi:hypothetical protein JXA84_08035 [candidate division WOR-3 bacterium]|nr:hypothetical protein [candidate division WOR-3 bacterium]
MTKACLIVLFLFSTRLFCEEKNKIQLTPTEDENSPTGYYIPSDIEDCINELDIMLPRELIDKMTERTEEDMIEYHHGLEKWIRNNSGLWSDSRLSEYFNSMGVFHPDDMFSIVIISYWRNLNGEPIELNEQIKYYKEFWSNPRK